MRFYAFNPLAGGILSGKYRFDEPAATGRYAKGTVMGDRYRYVLYVDSVEKKLFCCSRFRCFGQGILVCGIIQVLFY